MDFSRLIFVVYVLNVISQLVLGIRTQYDLLVSSTFNVLDYGAIGDGRHDDSAAFSKAWEAVCAMTGDTPTLTVPAGKTFLLTPLSFHGPCHSATSIRFEIQGNLVAPDNRDAWKNCEGNSWILFSQIHNLIVEGSGEINGKGSIWWKNNYSSNTVDYHQNGVDLCGRRPRALSFIGCNGLQLKGLTHVDSPGSHISIGGCNNSIVSNLRIIAPESSPNTDGIDISSSSQVQISDSYIGTGDDCIAIGSETLWINISRITCGPGHGISVGSLGKDGEYAKVEHVYVRNCTFNGSSNGARIKTWQGGSGYVRSISFEDIPLINVGNPIVIDQHYCNGFHNCTVQKSAVGVEGVRYRGFHGTSASEAAISLNCSNEVACTGIFMDSINITSSNPSVKTYAICENAQGKAAIVAPEVPCLNH